MKKLTSLSKKRNSINYFNQRNEEDSLENYGRNLPTILASCSNDSFGTIVYINDKASQLLMSSMGNIIGSSILNLIPQPYSSRHEKLMRDFIFHCNSTDVPSHEALFFLQNNGYLLECELLIKLTAFHNCAYFLLSFKESSKKRQVALISEEGAILAHTEMFSRCIGFEGKNMRGALISDLIPVADTCQMKELEPCKISLNGWDIIITHIAKQIKTRAVHMVAIVDDINEIQNWKAAKSQMSSREINSASSDENDKEELSRSNLEVKFHSDDYLVPEKSFDNPDTTVVTHSRESQLPDQILERRKFIDKVSDSESQSKGGAGHAQHQAKKLLMDSKRKIRVLQIVLFVVMSSVIITVAAILVYMEIDVSYTSTLGSFQTFGQLVYDFELSADLSLVINALVLYNGFKEEINYEVEKMKTLIEDWEKIKGSIFKDFDQWSYCSFSNVVSEPSILLWNLEHKILQNKKENLYDTIAYYIYNAKKLIAAVDEGYDQLPYAKFLTVNGLGGIFHDASVIMNGLASCEIERVKSTGTNINVLLVSGFCTLGILVLIIIGYIMLVSRKVDEFWNFTLNSGQWAMFRLKCSAIDRLATTHGVDCKADASPESQRNAYHTRSVKGALYIQYIWRIMLFFVIAASYYLLIFSHLYPTLDQMMITRPSLLNNFIIRRALYLRLSLFARDRVVDYTYWVIPEFYNYRQSLAEEALIIDYIIDLTNDLQTKRYSELLSDELKGKMYEKDSQAYKIMDYGSSAALLTLMRDIVDIGYVRGETNAYFLKFIDKMKAVMSEIEEEFVLADRDSINIINKQLDTIINTTIIYALALCALFFFYYFPYFNLQIKQLQRFAILPTILPKDID